jgi:transcriptional regulator with XRE-family HTH domain
MCAMPAATDPERLRILGDAIRQRRLELGLTVDQAAAMAPPLPSGRKMSNKTWGQLESGATSPRVSTYRRVETVLDVPPGTCQQILSGQADSFAAAANVGVEIVDLQEEGLLFVAENWRRLPVATRMRIIDQIRAVRDTELNR